MNRLKRLLEMEKLLRSGSYPSLEVLAKGKAVRTAHQDIKELREVLKLDVRYSREQRGYYIANTNLEKIEPKKKETGKTITISRDNDTVFRPVYEDAIHSGDIKDRNGTTAYGRMVGRAYGWFYGQGLELHLPAEPEVEDIVAGVVQALGFRMQDAQIEAHDARNTVKQAPELEPVEWKEFEDWKLEGWKIMQILSESTSRKEFLRMIGVAPKPTGAPPGQRHGKSKLTEREVVRIKEMIADGMTDLQIARKVRKVTYMNIHSIRTGRSWSHVKLSERSSSTKKVGATKAKTEKQREASVVNFPTQGELYEKYKAQQTGVKARG